MISVIHGAEGSGKTKRIIDAANAACEKATGLVIFIADNDQSLGVSPNVRYINLREYDVKSEDEFIGFLKGMLAANFDIQKIFIDGINRLLKLPADALKPIFDTMAKVSDGVDFITTVSAEKLPSYLKAFSVND